MKSIFASKTFWLNLLGGAISIGASGIIPPKYSMPTMAVANIGMRLLTNQAAYVVPPVGK
jgi:hypothetical protein